jgi:secondary thiamine-phosphate synthase enzyme
MTVAGTGRRAARRWIDDAMVVTARVDVSTRGQGDVRDLTAAVAHALRDSGLDAGLATIFVAGSTAAVTTMEFERGAVKDLDALFERLAPREAPYQHHLAWGDDNGSSHARAALVGPSVSIPFEGGRLLLGTWQQVVLLEFDTRPRSREVVVQLLGEPKRARRAD